MSEATGLINSEAEELREKSPGFLYEGRAYKQLEYAQALPQRNRSIKSLGMMSKKNNIQLEDECCN